MNKEEMDKYAYELMVKNNPDEAVKNLLLKDKQITNLQEEIKSANESITWWQNRFNAIEKNIKELQQKVQQYENPDDLTLFYMWLDTKAKDKMKELETINTSLKQTNAMLSLLGRDYKSRCENAKIYIKEHSNNLVEYLDVFEVKDLLEILEGDEGIK